MGQTDRQTDGRTLMERYMYITLVVTADRWLMSWAVISLLELGLTGRPPGRASAAGRYSCCVHLMACDGFICSDIIGNELYTRASL